MENSAARMRAMIPRHAIIAYLTPWYLHAGRHLDPERLCAVQTVRAAAPQEWEVEVLAFAANGGRQNIEAGVALRLLSAAVTSDRPDDTCSWELPRALSADLVHIHEPFCRAGQVGLLVARLLGKPVCVRHTGAIGEGLGEALNVSSLADAVVPADVTADQLGHIYRELLAGRGGLAE
jgi:hypothetical protein